MFAAAVRPTTTKTGRSFLLHRSHFSRRAVVPSIINLNLPSSLLRTMVTITEGVEFDTIAREWRCKWSADNDKKSLQEAQKALDDVLADLKEVAGCKQVQRVVCGGCLDFKVIASFPEDKFGDWEKKAFAPEKTFLDQLERIAGITAVETQTYTLMPM